MNTFLIAHDMNGENLLQVTFQLTLERFFSSSCQPLPSGVIVETEMSATEVRDCLSPYMYPADPLLIIPVDKQAAWMGLSDDNEAWMQSHTKTYA